MNNAKVWMTMHLYQDWLQSAFLSVSLSILLSLLLLSTYHLPGGGAVMPSHIQGDLVLCCLVSELTSHMLQSHLYCPSQTNS
jgi:hypothetical protein